MRSFREHGVLIYLSKDLYVGFIKLQADRGLGRSYAGLVPFVEGLYHLGYISKTVYEEHIKKYSQPLGSENPVWSLEGEKKKQALEEKKKQLKGMLEAWDEKHFSPDWHEKVVAEALKYPDLEYSKQLVAKGKERGIISQGGA